MESVERSHGGSFLLGDDGRPDANGGRTGLHPHVGAGPWQAWVMSATSDAMNRIVVNIVRLARRPGLMLLVAAGVPVGVFLLLGLLVGLDAVSWVGWVPFALAVVLAVPVGVLAVRRERLQRATADLGDHRVTTVGGVVVVSGEQAGSPLEEELSTLGEALDEGRVHTARWFPRVEAAQRALLRAAGGPVNAPYLRDDLRVTLVAFLGTVAAIPLGVLGAFVCAFALLLG